MSFPVLCADGVDRLKVRWETREEAVRDASYFGAYRLFGCASWAEDGTCPGGAHYVPGPDSEPELELPLAWTVDLVPV